METRKALRKAMTESRKAVRKAVEEIGNPLTKLGKPLRKNGNFGVSFRHQICYHACAWIYFVDLKYSQFKINHHSNTPSTKGDWGWNLQWCGYQGC
jgi:hypothetical protein